jgi:hypothetical protein
MPATVTFSGLSPYSVALYQVDAQVPAGISAGDAVDVVLQMQDPGDERNGHVEYRHHSGAVARSRVYIFNSIGD